MKIAVMGTGGVGGYFGARLAAGGADVSFVARGAHLDAIRSNGLEVLSGPHPTRIEPAVATDDPAEIGPVDMVLFTVKLWDTTAAGELCRPLIGPETGVVILQNGVDAVDVLSPILGREHLIGGVANISAIIERPGVIRHFDQLQILRFGELEAAAAGSPPSARIAAFRDVCIAGGIETVLPENILHTLWEKFVFLSSLSAANCLTRQATGPIRSDPVMRRLLADLIGEALAVAEAEGIGLPTDQDARTLATIDALPEAMKTSMLVGLERGERLEAPWLSGAVVARGERLGVDTPCHRAALAALTPYLSGVPA